MVIKIFSPKLFRRLAFCQTYKLLGLETEKAKLSSLDCELNWFGWIDASANVFTNSRAWLWWHGWTGGSYLPCAATFKQSLVTIVETVEWDLQNQNKRYYKRSLALNRSLSSYSWQITVRFTNEQYFDILGVFHRADCNALRQEEFTPSFTLVDVNPQRTYNFLITGIFFFGLCETLYCAGEWAF